VVVTALDVDVCVVVDVLLCVVAVLDLVVAVLERVVLVTPPEVLDVELPGVAPETWNCTVTMLDTTFRPVRSVGTVAGASPSTTYPSRVLSTSSPKDALPLTHVAHTSVDPSDCFETLMIWNRSARLASGPPNEAAVVESVTTRPGKLALRPGLPAVAARTVAGRRSGSFVLKARSMTIPVPLIPCVDPSSGEYAFPTTRVLGAVEDVDEDDDEAFFFLDEEQAASAKAATSVRTTIRFMGRRAYL
jgi:hypothetical protein